MRVTPVANITGQMVYPKHQPRKKTKGKAESESPWSKYGTDEDYRKFVREMPSCLDGLPNCQSCHVRRSSIAGTAFKPPYSCVPMTDEQHKEQSWRGEAACLNRFRPRAGGWTNLDAKEWFDNQAEITRIAWIASKGLKV